MKGLRYDSTENHHETTIVDRDRVRGDGGGLVRRADAGAADAAPLQRGSLPQQSGGRDNGVSARRGGGRRQPCPRGRAAGGGESGRLRSGDVALRDGVQSAGGVEDLDPVQVEMEQGGKGTGGPPFSGNGPAN